jgi:hypothetical protein
MNPLKGLKLNGGAITQSFTYNIMQMNEITHIQEKALRDMLRHRKVNVETDFVNGFLTAFANQKESNPRGCKVKFGRTGKQIFFPHLTKHHVYDTVTLCVYSLAAHALRLL